MRTATLRSRSRMARAAARPSEPGIFTSRMTRSGWWSRTRSTASSPRPVSPDHVVPLVLEDLLQIEPDDRLVLGDDHPPGHWGRARLSCAVDAGVSINRVRPPVGRAVRPGGARARRSARPGPSRVCSMTDGVPARLVVLLGGHRGLGHQGPQPGVVGDLVHHHQLLVEDGQLGAGAHQPLVGVTESAFEGGPMHGRAILRMAQTLCITRRASARVGHRSGTIQVRSGSRPSEVIGPVYPIQSAAGAEPGQRRRVGRGTHARSGPRVGRSAGPGPRRDSRGGGTRSAPR